MKDFRIATDGKGTTSATRKIQFLHTTLRREALREFDAIASQVGITTNGHLKSIKEGLLSYFYPTNALNKKKYSTRRAMIKLWDLTFKIFAARLTELNNYLPLLPVSSAAKKCTLKNSTIFSFMTSLPRWENKHKYGDGTLKEGPTRTHAKLPSAWKHQRQSTKEEHLPKTLNGKKPTVPVLVGIKRE